jgi:Ca2+-binding RTX toxin-like protein
LLTYPITTTGTYFIDIGSFANSNTGEYSLFVRSATAFPLATVELLTFNNDISSFASGTKIVLGGSGADVIDLGSDSSTALGEQGNDIITGDVGDDHISGGLGHDTIHGSSGHDTLFGDSGDDTIFGSNGFDRIFGGAGDDVIDGGADADVMTGGTGKDFLRGRDGIDAFVFRSPAESPRGAGRDVIIDFETGDQISLTQIDAKSGGADNAFKFIGTQGFHHKAGELRYKINAANDVTLVQGDVNGDGKADFEIELSGQNVLHSTDFFL